MPTKSAAPPSTEGEATEDVPATKEKIEDWLVKLRESPPIEDEGTLAPPKPLTPPPPAPATELPNWVQEVAQPPLEQAPPISSEREESAADVETAPSPPETREEVPGWLKDLDQNTGLPDAAPKIKDEAPQPPSQRSFEELPSWLRPSSEEQTASGEPSPIASREEREQAGRFQPPAPESPTEPVPEINRPVRTEDIQSWIAKLKPAEAEAAPAPHEPQVEAEPEPEVDEPVGAEDIQSWIAKLKPAEAEPEPIEPARAGEIPSWVAESKPTEAESEALIQRLGAEIEPKPEPLEPAKAEERLPWVAESKPTEAESEALIQEPEAEAEPEPEPLEPAKAEEIPPWIAELRPAEDQSATQTQELEAEIPTEELADWLRGPKPEPRPAIAPMEAAGEPVEATGPLANLRGVLPLATAVTEPHPFAQTAPAEKKDGAHLFEEILAEPQMQVARTTRRRVRRGLLTMRPAIYLALAFAVILALFVPPSISGSLVGISGTPAAEFYDAIQSLPNNSTVVVSFDYDPSVSGEMDLISLAILRHLIQRRINIVGLSTLEPGPMIAQRVLAIATAGKSDYRYGVNFLNAGLVAGHESGLVQLATQGFQTNARDFDQNRVIGQYPIAANVKNIKSVSMVIELAGGEETLKNWLGQFQPQANLRIAAGVSAAVEPKARVYRDAKQLTALVSGPVGAAQYEILSNQQGQAVRQATAQSLAQIVLIMVVLAGNAVFWISRVMENK